MVDKKTVSTLVAEFLGTGTLTLAVLTVRGSAIGIPYFVAITAGLVVGLAILVANGIEGAQLNPAVTIGLWTVKKVKSLQAVLNIAFQLLGGYVALRVFDYFVKTTQQTVGGHYSARVMIAEAVGTFIFTFALAAAVYQKYEASKLAVVGGIAFIVGMVIAASATNGLINPAVALGLKSWSWGTYVLGPVVGSVIGMNLYSIVFADGAKVVTSKAKKK